MFWHHEIVHYEINLWLNEILVRRNRNISENIYKDHKNYIYMYDNEINKRICIDSTNCKINFMFNF